MSGAYFLAEYFGQKQDFGTLYYCMNCLIKIVEPGAYDVVFWMADGRGRVASSWTGRELIITERIMGDSGETIKLHLTTKCPLISFGIKAFRVEVNKVGRAISL